jgi:hypothetical protein
MRARLANALARQLLQPVAGRYVQVDDALGGIDECTPEGLDVLVLKRADSHHDSS